MTDQFLKLAIMSQLITMLASGAAALVQGYECSETSPNITTVSLLEVGPCSAPGEDIVTEEIPVQLLQKSLQRKIPLVRCKVVEDQTIMYCGMHSHNSLVNGGSVIRVNKLSMNDCRELVRFNQLQYGRVLLSDLIPNTTNYRSVVRAGALTDDGACTGENINFRDREYKNVVVTVKLTIEYSDEFGSYNEKTNELLTSTGVRCAYSDYQCMSTEQFQYYWNAIKVNDCDFDLYTILYEGTAVKVSTKNATHPPAYFANGTKGIRFGLSSTGHESVCGYDLVQTEHSQLFILEGGPARSFATNYHLTNGEVSIISYFNTKISYLEHHLSGELKKAYADMIMHTCELERRIIIDAMPLIHSRPDIFAYKVMRGEGFTAIAAGEVGHIIKCKPVTCKLKLTNECFVDLPANCGDKDVFLRPQSHVVTYVGTQVPCNPLTPSLFQINGRWRQTTGKRVEFEQPTIIQPAQKPTWHYRELQDFMETGIYTQDDVQRLERHLTFPLERAALLNSVAQHLSGEGISRLNLKTLIDEDSIRSIAINHFQSFWNKFVQFGTISAGILMILLIFQVIKFLINAIVNGMALHQLYGCGAHILGALCSSIAYLLIRKRRQDNNPNDDATIGEYSPADVEATIRQQPQPQVSLRGQATHITLPLSRPHQRRIDDTQTHSLRQNSSP